MYTHTCIHTCTDYCMSGYMHTCMYVDKHTYLYAYNIYMDALILTCIHIYRLMDFCLHIYTYACNTHVYPLACLTTFMHACRYTYKHTHYWLILIHSHSCLSTYIHPYLPKYTYTCICTHINMCTYINTSIHTDFHACLSTYIHIYMDAYMHTLMHVCLYTYIHIDACLPTYSPIYICTAYVCAFRHTCIHTYIHMYVHKYMETHVCQIQTVIQILMFVSLQIFLHTYISG